MLERDYQPHVIECLEEMFPGCMILKNDSGYLQGIPDLTILYLDRWAVLEVKRSADEPYQPNQEYYLELLNGMSFAARIDPSNELEVFSGLQLAFQRRRNARIPRRE